MNKMMMTVTRSEKQAEEAAPAQHGTKEKSATAPQTESETNTTRKTTHNPDSSQPLQTKMATAAGEEANQRAQQKVNAPQMVPSATALRLCEIADKVLGQMAEVQQQITEFKQYISSEKDEGKPLYQWAKYQGYGAINRAIRGLDAAAAQFESVRLPEEHVKMYRVGARQFSTSVSNSAVFVMDVMAGKSATCIDEIEESNLSPEGKANANTLINVELKKVIKYCVGATGRTWAALDLLEENLLIDDTKQKDVFIIKKDVSIIKKRILESEARQRASRKGWLWTTATLVLSAAASATIGLAAAHLYGPAAFDMALRSSGGGEGMYAQITDLVRRTQAVTNLTGEICSIKLQDIDQRYKELKTASEGHGLRIDSLVEALGPPNEEGMYSYPMPKPDAQVPGDVSQYIQKVSDNVDREMNQLHHEMQQMRKNINRMDIRLTKRLDKVDRYTN